MRHHYRLSRITNIHRMTPHTGNNREQQELSLWLKDIQNGTADLENNWAVSYKTRHHVPWNLPKGIENSCKYEIVHMHVIYSTFIHTCKILASSKVSFHWQLHKLGYIHTMEYLVKLIHRYICYGLRWPSGKGKTTESTWRSQLWEDVGKAMFNRESSENF